MKMNIRLFFAAFLLSSNIYAQWDSLPIEEGFSVIKLDMVSETVGYGHYIHNSDGRYVAQTKDAGLSWDLINIPDTLNPNTIGNIDFYAENKGLLLTTDWSMPSSPTSVIKTKDNGASWEDITPSEFWGGYLLLNVLNDDVIFMASGSFLFKTLDGGESWTTHEAPSYIESLDFLDEQNGVIGLFDGTFAYIGGMYCTSDGGNTWQGIMLDSTYSVVTDVQMINENFVVATPFAPIVVEDSYHNFFVSEDKGISWEIISYPELTGETSLLGIEFKNTNEALISIGGYEDSKIYKTIDGGDSWTLELELPEYTVIGITYAGDLSYLFGDSDKIYKSSLPSSTKDFNVQSVNAFPNPARPGSPLHFSMVDDFDFISIYNQSGQLVFEQKIDYSKSIVVPDLKTGIYTASLRNKFKVATSKIYILED